ncbi:Serine/threonine protein phosphatase 5 like protein [Aduncisulcus paluster]|uniref:Serine/threonine-protein phosphatase n=1 Tax=Aduncisulcus paluster TaxID=2918883 RepID=A0ABQ5KN05_9EUKA|nr:Serine/threonine protein phosphatase 5 like protein [Aduncisulcus paluster]|eukprot:gnl/Carplike_NY0171/494_a679_2051.p1 GENE.gnl/Carplike_NY0171/494_a679_2051~~gnl/Carplike_NY0171/494_a679_2051.p1  ORF type:complete len:326 (+),score=62.83 gnl/Carplike_NY0171/494_a679_2051:59-1036(+)
MEKPTFKISFPITEEDIPTITEALESQKRLAVEDLYRLLREATDIMNKRENIATISLPVGKRATVIGDVHGQFYDLLHIIRKDGGPSADCVYIWNGDMIDRGSFGVEIVILVCSYLLVYPDSVYVNRGNHESRYCTPQYGFQSEVAHKYPQRDSFDHFILFFESLPLATIVNSHTFIVHGGLPSVDGVSLADINGLDRHREPDDDVMGNLLWADPSVTEGFAPSYRPFCQRFGPDVTKRFLAHNKLKRVIRSHEMAPYGYSEPHSGILYTLFSAPKYMGVGDNLGAFAHLTPTSTGDLKLEFEPFEASPHPAAPSYTSPATCDIV